MASLSLELFDNALAGKLRAGARERPLGDARRNDVGEEVVGRARSRGQLAEDELRAIRRLWPRSLLATEPPSKICSGL